LLNWMLKICRWLVVLAFDSILPKCPMSLICKVPLKVLLSSSLQIQVKHKSCDGKSSRRQK
jgi:hypothetical protein